MKGITIDKSSWTIFYYLTLLWIQTIHTQQANVPNRTSYWLKIGKSTFPIYAKFVASCSKIMKYPTTDPKPKMTGLNQMPIFCSIFLKINRSTRQTDFSFRAQGRSGIRPGTFSWCGAQPSRPFHKFEATKYVTSKSIDQRVLCREKSSTYWFWGSKIVTCPVGRTPTELENNGIDTASIKPKVCRTHGIWIDSKLHEYLM